MDLGEVISITDFTNVISEIGDLFYYVFNAIIKLLFNDFKIFGVPIGLILIMFLIIRLIATNLLKLDMDND